MAIAWAFSGSEDILRLAFRIASIVFGPLLGVFLLGTLTRRGTDAASVTAMVAAGVLLLLLDGYQRTTSTVYVAWPWYIVIGTWLTFLWGLLARPRNGGHSSGLLIADSAP